MKSKPPFLCLYWDTFTVTERLAFIAFLEYLLVAYCRWSEQSWGSGHGGTGPLDRRTKALAELRLSEKGPDKSLRRRALYGLAEGRGGRVRGDCAHAPRPKSWWAAGARPCVVHYHTQQAPSATPPSMGRRMPPCWLPQNLVRKARETKAPAPLGEGHW